MLRNIRCIEAIAVLPWTP